MAGVPATGLASSRAMSGWPPTIVGRPAVTFTSPATGITPWRHAACCTPRSPWTRLSSVQGSCIGRSTWCHTRSWLTRFSFGPRTAITTLAIITDRPTAPGASRVASSTAGDRTIRCSRMSYGNTARATLPRSANQYHDQSLFRRRPSPGPDHQRHQHQHQPHHHQQQSDRAVQAIRGGAQHQHGAAEQCSGRRGPAAVRGHAANGPGSQSE